MFAMKQSEIDEPESGLNGETVVVLDMCKCGRAPKRRCNSSIRPIQGNCHFCNAEANKKYHRALKKYADGFKRLTAMVRDI